MFGGQNASSESTFDASNEVYVLDTCTLNWSQPIVHGKPPIPRAGHEAISVLNQYMIVMMGKWIAICIYSTKTFTKCIIRSLRYSELFSNRWTNIHR